MADRGRGSRGGGSRGRGRGGRGDDGRGQSSFRGTTDRSRGGATDRGGSSRGGHPYSADVPYRGPRGGKKPASVFRGATGTVPQIDPYVEEVENKVGANLEKYVRENQGKLNPQFPDRPGYGSQGKKVTLWANYFHLQVNKDMKLYKYRIEITPVSSAREAKGRKSQRIVDLLIQDHFSAKRHTLATDYKRTLISTEELPTKHEYRVSYRDENADPSDEDPVYRLILQHDSEDGHPMTISIQQLLNYLNSQSASAFYQQKPSAIQALNIIVGHYPKSNPQIASIGANKHFATEGPQFESQDLGEGLVCLRGFFISVRPATCRILLNIQVKHAAMYKAGDVPRVIAELVGHTDKRYWPGPMHKFLARVRVNLTHLTRKNKFGDDVPRVRTIHGVATPTDGQDTKTKKSPTDTEDTKTESATASKSPRVSAFGANAKNVSFFLEKPPDDSELRANEYVTVYEYFRAVYHHPCSDYPVLNVGNREHPIYVPPEVCKILPGQPAGVKLSGSQTNRMTRFSIRDPDDNATTIIRKGPGLLGLAPLNQTLNAFNIKTASPPNMITVTGRILPSPSVLYRDKKLENPLDGNWNLTKVKFTRGAQLNSWSFLTMKKGNDGIPPGPCKDLIANFQTAMTASGIGASKYKGFDAIDLDAPDADQKLRGAFNKVVKFPNHMIIAILPSKDLTKASVYKKIKAYGDIEYGVHTVCMTASNLSKDDKRIYANISLKVNSKMGGTNHDLAPGHCSLIRQGKTMLVGLDVTHPSPGSRENAPSVAAMVASIGPDLGQWPAKYCIQDKARKEMVSISQISELLKSRLRLWQKHNNGNLPENILLYRDGVSEGQYQSTLDVELAGMRQACQEMYPADLQKAGLPRFSVLIAGKRHHGRFYAAYPNEAQGRGNTKPGTVVDRGVTEAHNWDFFLQPHAAIQGTARPAHYFVVYDEIFRNKALNPKNERPADMLERLTHEISYLYVRATKAVSLVPPAYYADLACERARTYLVDVYDGSPEQTPAATESGNSDAERSVFESKITVHPNLQDTMFYI